MTATLTIPLNHLSPWRGNVRKTGADLGVDELAASIAAHGLLQPLVVREGKHGKYQIIAGRRRYMALTRLAKDGVITKDHGVACTLLASDADGTEISLVENVVRVAMHPADQFAAFAKLIDGGASVADIAARFGLSERLVQQRLKLGRLSPVILDAYRACDIDLDCAQAFAISDDHAAQERVLAESASWNLTPHAIRSALTDGDVRATDRRVRFIGLDAYEAHGGTVRRDLFGDDDDAFVLDPDLLDRLVTAKLEDAAGAVAAEGWRWVECVREINHAALARFSRRYPDRAELSDTDQAELDALSEAYDTLVDSDGDDAGDRISAIESRMDDLTAKTETWAPETLAIAGAILSVGYDGDLRIERGLVRGEDEPDEPSRGEDDASPESSGPALPARLIEQLTAHRTAALGTTLAQRPDIALAAVVHAMLVTAFHPHASESTCLKVRSGFVPVASSLDDTPSAALDALAAIRDRLESRLPSNADSLWDWCLAKSRDELLEMLAGLAALQIDAVQHKPDRPDCARLVHADALARALDLDMTVWFKPTAASYFSRVTRSQIIADIVSATGSCAPALDKLKKADLAHRAEALTAGKGWLPAPLRIARADADAHDADTEAA